MNEGWIETYTGKRIYPLHPDPEQIDICDIAHHLSLICRYTGACSQFYSVAQHSIHVSYIVRQLIPEAVDEEYRRKSILTALLHDAAEAYLGDMSSPVKQSMPKYVEAEKVLLGMIMKKFGAVGGDWEIVKKADYIMLATETRQFMNSKGEGWYLPEPPRVEVIQEFSNEEVEIAFLKCFQIYYEKESC